MTPVDMLRAAKSLIEDPTHWITGDYARTSADRCIGANCPNACKFCAIGAIAHVANMEPERAEKELDAAIFLYMAAVEMHQHFFPHRVNDDLGHAAVMKMYDRAIELASAPS